MRNGKRKKVVAVKENRKYQRQNKYLFAFCQYPSKRRMLDVEGNPVEIEENILRDVGGGGVMIEREEFISFQEKILMEIYLPTDDVSNTIISVFAEGEVSWVKKTKKRGENKYQIGIKFNDIREDDKQKIINKLKKNAYKEIES
ncbi:PilZ domain-containing protein [bacterium]|nr:PilZ domain-containing protein [bacterium]